LTTPYHGRKDGHKKELARKYGISPHSCLLDNLDRYSNHISLLSDREMVANFEGRIEASIAKPPSVWKSSPNFSPGNQGRYYVMIHKSEGPYYGSVEWLRNTRARASAHIVIREDGLEVSELVKPEDTSLAGNLHDLDVKTINIQMAGHASQGYSEGLLKTCAMWVRYYCDLFGIPVRWAVNLNTGLGYVRSGIGTHSCIPLVGRDYLGLYFPHDDFLRRVRDAVGGAVQPAAFKTRKINFVATNPEDLEIAKSASSAINDVDPLATPAEEAGDSCGKVLWIGDKVGAAPARSIYAVLVGSRTSRCLSPYQQQFYGQSPVYSDVWTGHAPIGQPSDDLVGTKKGVLGRIAEFCEREGFSQTDAKKVFDDYSHRVGLSATKPSSKSQGTHTLWGVHRGYIVPRTGYYKSWRPNYPYQKTHWGEDVYNPTNNPVWNLKRGIVYRVRDFGSVDGYNQEITLYYPDDGIYLLVGHVRAGVSWAWEPGDVIERGWVIAHGGTVADSIYDDYVHQHFQVWADQKSVDKYVNENALSPEDWRKRFAELPITFESNPYLGDYSTPTQFAHWMARAAHRKGLPPETPVCCSLVELPGAWEEGPYSVRQIRRYSEPTNGESLGFFQQQPYWWGFETGKETYQQRQKNIKNPIKALRYFLDAMVAIKRIVISSAAPTRLAGNYERNNAMEILRKTTGRTMKAGKAQQVYESLAGDPSVVRAIANYDGSCSALGKWIQTVQQSPYADRYVEHCQKARELIKGYNEEGYNE
jgi:hypothetical protein